MPIVIKEIHVRTTVEKRPEEARLSPEAMAALKRSLLKEITAAKESPIKKDR